MKRFVAVLIGVSGLLAFSAFAQAPAQGTPAGHKMKMAHMTVTGKVLEISDTGVKVEHRVKGKAEVMELTLEKPLTGIATGDEVTVAYHSKDGKHFAMKVHKPVDKKKAANTEVPKK
jgi:hypothetical protein